MWHELSPIEIKKKRPNKAPRTANVYCDPTINPSDFYLLSNLFIKCDYFLKLAEREKSTGSK